MCTQSDRPPGLQARASGPGLQVHHQHQLKEVFFSILKRHLTQSRKSAHFKTTLKWEQCFSLTILNCIKFCTMVTFAESLCPNILLLCSITLKLKRELLCSNVCQHDVPRPSVQAGKCRPPSFKKVCVQAGKCRPPSFKKVCVQAGKCRPPSFKKVCVQVGKCKPPSFKKVCVQAGKCRPPSF